MRNIQIFEFSYYFDDGIHMKDSNMEVHGIAADIAFLTATDKNVDIVSCLSLFVVNAKVEAVITHYGYHSIDEIENNVIILPPYLLVSAGNPYLYHKMQADITEYAEYFEGKELIYNQEIIIEGARYAHFP